MQKVSDTQRISASEQQKIQLARSLYDVCSGSLRQDPSIRLLLQRLKNCIENSKESMVALGVFAECKHCEEEEGGSCCGAGIEKRYDPALLLINLLLGAELPRQVRCQNSCYFLGENGCLLTARHVLCVNYICQKLRRKLTREELIALQSSAGEELDTLFLLNEAVKKHIRSHTKEYGSLLDQKGVGVSASPDGVLESGPQSSRSLQHAKTPAIQ